MTCMERLPPDVEARLPAIKDEWLGYGLSTEPADRPQAEAAVRRAYEAAGLAPPAVVIWLDSPLAGCMGATLGDQVRDQVWDQVWDQVRAQVRDQVRDQVGAQVGAQVWAQVRDQVGDQVGAQARDQVWAQVGDQAYQCGYGQHDAGWLVFYDVFRAAGLSTERLAGLMDLARSCGWWWPFRSAVILTERPSVLRRDAAGRLHCEDGPAMRYPDGWSIYAWHGLRVPEQVIMRPESLTVADVRDERNAELRRVMLTRYGEARYLDDIGAMVVHEDATGRLIRAPMPGDEDLVMVRVVNATPEPDGTRKTYTLRVPPTVQSAHEAVAWTFGLRPEEYQPEVET